MKKIALLLPLIIFSVYANVYPKELEIISAVLDVHPEYEFFIIDAGTQQGIEIGDGLIVHRDNEKVGEAYIIEVRVNVSAAEILTVEKDKKIQQGDKVLIIKQAEGKPEEIKGDWKRPQAARESRAAKGLRHRRAGVSKSIDQGDIISAKIKTGSMTVFSYARLTLEENGYLIISSNRSTGVILAKKPISLSILSELWADATAAIGHRLVASFDIKGSGQSSTLKVVSFKEHSQKEKYIKIPVRENSVFYNELSDIVSKIKERSEL